MGFDGVQLMNEEEIVLGPSWSNSKLKRYMSHDQFH